MGKEDPLGNANPYRNDLEAQLCNAKAEVAELKNSLEFARKQLVERKNKMKFTALGKFVVFAVIIVCLLGTISTFFLVLANGYKIVAAVGGGAVTMTILGGLGCGIIAGNWGDIFNRR